MRVIRNDLRKKDRPREGQTDCNVTRKQYPVRPTSPGSPNKDRVALIGDSIVKEQKKPAVQLWGARVAPSAGIAVGLNLASLASPRPASVDGRAKLSIR